MGYKKSPETNRRYYLKHHEERRAHDRYRYYRDIEKNRERARQYYYANKGKYKKPSSEYVNEYHRRKRLELISKLGGKCVWENCKAIDNLEIDHILGGGNVDFRVRFSGGHAVYRYYLKHFNEAKGKLQVLCKRHNDMKRKIMGEHNSKEYIDRTRGRLKNLF